MDLSVVAEPAFVKAVIRVFHFVGLALGLGTATFLDLVLLRFMMWGEITPSQAQAFDFGTRVVTSGLAILWITGVMFLLYYWVFDVKMLANPKIWAKLSIVGVLTGNAFYLHKVVLPIVSRQVSRTLLHGTTTPERIQMVFGGAISLVSWYVPVALGVIPQLNFSVPAQEIWLTYCAMLGTAIVAGFSALVVIRHKVPASAIRTSARDTDNAELSGSNLS